jgi:hypothetical protein
MKRSFRYVVAVSAVLVLFLSSCGRGRVRVIPRDELAEIYAEMMMTDQWILNTPNVRLIADTSLVYDPILEKYGYDSDDYRKSIDVYMDDPERFAKILKVTGEILEGRLKDLELKKEEMERLEMLRKEAEKFRPDLDFDEMFPYFKDEPYVHYHDSLAFEMDSITRIYRISPVELADTVYDGVRMVIRSVEPDTLAVVDSTVVPEPVQELEPEPVPMQELEPIREFRPKTIRDIDNKADESMEPIKINRQL